MSFVEPIDPLDIQIFAEGYQYDPLEFVEFESALHSRVEVYAGNKSQQMLPHMERTAHSLEKFMHFKFMDEKVINNIARGFSLHDVVKVTTDPAYWTGHDGPLPDILKAMRKIAHVDGGWEFLEEAVKPFPRLHGHPHLSVIGAGIRYHHERINGSGPFGLIGDQLGFIVQMMGIVDEFDGKTLPRPGREPKDSGLIFTEMSGEPSPIDGIVRHKGEFDAGLLYEFRAVKLQLSAKHLSEVPSEACKLTIS